MFISEALIALIFRLINFGLIIMMLVYVFQKYIRPGLLIAMAKEESEKEFLLSQQLLYEQKQAELDQLIKNERLLCEHFKIKINEWKRVTQEELVAHKRERALLVARIERKKTEKAERRESETVKQCVANKVVDQLETSLTKHFDAQNVGKKYINAIVSFMDEGVL